MDGWIGTGIVIGGADQLKPDSKGNRILHFAARSGNVEFYKSMENTQKFKTNKDLHGETQRNAMGRLPIYYAIKYNHIHLIHYLISSSSLSSSSSSSSLELIYLTAYIRHHRSIHNYMEIYELIKGKIAKNEWKTIEKVEMLYLEKIKYDFYENEGEYKMVKCYFFGNDSECKKVSTKNLLWNKNWHPEVPTLQKLMLILFQRKTLNIEFLESEDGSGNQEIHFIIEYSERFEESIVVPAWCFSLVLDNLIIQQRVELMEKLIDKRQKLLLYLPFNKQFDSIFTYFLDFSSFLQDERKIDHYLEFLFDSMKKRQGLRRSQPPFSDTDKENILRKLLFISSSHANTISFYEIFNRWLLLSGLAKSYSSPPSPSPSLFLSSAFEQQQQIPPEGGGGGEVEVVKEVEVGGEVKLEVELEEIIIEKSMTSGYEDTTEDMDIETIKGNVEVINTSNWEEEEGAVECRIAKNEEEYGMEEGMKERT